MDKEQIQAAKERAEQVVNGFKRVSDQNARDALNLAKLVELRNKQVESLVKRLEEKCGDSDDFMSHFRKFSGFDW